MNIGPWQLFQTVFEQMLSECQAASGVFTEITDFTGGSAILDWICNGIPVAFYPLPLRG